MSTAALIREQLAEQQRRVRFIIIAHAGVYVAVMVMLVFRLYVPAVVMSGVNLLLYLLFVRGQTVDYSEAVSRANVQYGLCAPLESVQVPSQTAVNAEKFRTLTIFPFMEGKNSVLIRTPFSGRGYGLELGGCEFTVHYAIQGIKHTQYRFLSGTLLTAAFQPGSWNGNWLLLRRGLLDEDAQKRFLEGNGYTSVNCSGKGLDGGFQIYAGDGAETVPRWLARRLNQAIESTDRLAAVRLTDRTAAVYLENRFYTGRTKLRDLPNETWLAHCPLPERDAVWELFRSLSVTEE